MSPVGPQAVWKAGGEGLWAGQRPSISLQQCCDCCGLGLRVRAEGQSCESNPNLGYPCNHVMLSCCEGEDPLIVPEVRRPPEPEAVPRRGGCCSPSQAWGLVGDRGQLLGLLDRAGALWPSVGTLVTFPRSGLDRVLRLPMIDSYYFQDGGLICFSM